MIEHNLLLILAILPFVGSLVATTFSRNAHSAGAWLAASVMLVNLAILAILQPVVGPGGHLAATINWIPSLGLNLTFRIDGFVWLFMLLVQGTGLLVVLYSRYYLSPKDSAPRFHASLLSFAGAMGGVLLSGNIILMVVFWELTSLASFLLIGYRNSVEAARDGARTALTVTAAGGLCLLMGMMLIGYMAGGYELDRVLAAGDVIRAHPLYGPALALFLLGVFTKSAQVPFHFWLPQAMAAPTPVSAYLHSATMVKAGVFLLVRFSPVLGGTEAWFLVVSGVGMATYLTGAVIALFRHDLKGLLAYSTISHLGLIAALAGIGSPGAVVAAIFHIANHAVFKASLFMAAGIIDHETGTRDMRRLGGLIRRMPQTGLLAMVAAGAMAGVPLLNGFLSKEMFFAEAVGWHNGSVLDNALPWMAVLGGVFSVAYSIRFIRSVFFGPAAATLPKDAHEPPHWMRRPVEVLVLICLLVGILPGVTIGPYLYSAALAVLGPQVPDYSLALWHGVSAPLVMSLVAFGGGTLLYALLARRIAAGPEGPPLVHRIRAQTIFERLMLTLTWKWPRVLRNALGSDRLQPQLRLIVLLALVFAAFALWGKGALVPQWWRTEADVTFVLLWAVGGACAIGAAWQAKYHRLAALILLGGAGLVTCVTFALFSAPDLAVTQLLVEIVTTVLLLLGLRWLPKRRSEIVADTLLPARLRRRRDLIIAVASGAGIAALALTVMVSPQGPNVGDWFLANAYAEGGGTNVVNVILVDFRAFDTLGEITVLGVVAVTVFALLRRFRPAPDSAGVPEQQAGESEAALRNAMVIPSVIMRWMFAPIIVMAAYLFFRGHDLPGGGFAAGVTLAIGLLLQYLAADVRWVEARMRVLPVRWIGFGLLVSVATGAGAWLFGYPFLTAHARYVDLPLIGETPMATALLFDLGVFALVVGTTVLMLIALAHQSLRSVRARTQEGTRIAEEENAPWS
ncbi:monovalent cation/H+ antiporter subunit A [Novispirillum sp. DQ9]|uniref:monovalent cation/H+ antiporter subunit A n=1 Tax=Novispirillum sp. DQ9 TaxID=3398612 RepID=UPI003C7C8247